MLGRMKPQGSSETPSDVPDVLAPGLRIVFCGINPGRVSAAAGAHFANPRNDFWRLLHAARLTSRLYEPSEQFELLGEGLGVTNAAYRTTPGSGDLRRSDFAGSAARLEQIARELAPGWLAFVGKEAYRGAFGERPALGVQERRLGDTQLFVLPSTSPANAAVPYAERLQWFRALREWIEPVDRPAVRALLVDRERRTLLLRWEVSGHVWWITPGGGIDPGEDDEMALRRELYEEVGLADPELGPLVFERLNVLPYPPRLTHQSERFYLVRVEELEPSPTIDLVPEGVHGHRWWTADELEATAERFSPPELPSLLRSV